VRDNAQEDVQFLLTGNKSDLEGEKRIDFPAALREDPHEGDIETSAFTSIDLFGTAPPQTVATTKHVWTPTVANQRELAAAEGGTGIGPDGETFLFR
jgi:hypothetical protein